MNTGTGRPATRQAVREGAVPAPSPVKVSHPRSPKKPSRSVTPELSFSSVVSGRPPSPLLGLGDGLGLSSPGLIHEPEYIPSTTPLSRDVDFNLPDPDEDAGGDWIAADRRTSRTHSPRPASLTNVVPVASRVTPLSESTINQAEAEMSVLDLLRMAERHRFYAERAYAAARLRGQSASVTADVRPETAISTAGMGNEQKPMSVAALSPPGPWLQPTALL
ncbi:hypothetical protein B0H12DRAFT_1069709 [Mycena haematopus]|nr:hypothetical protein B0H12DRAFT_1069709 [Mycena haematopus]